MKINRPLGYQYAINMTFCEPHTIRPTPSNALIFCILPFSDTRNPNPIDFLIGKIFFTIQMIDLFGLKITLYNGQKNFKSQKFLHFRIPRIEKQSCIKN